MVTAAHPASTFPCGRKVIDLLICFEDDGYWVSESEKEKIFDVGYDTGQIRGLFLIRELLGFTGITIQEVGTPGAGVFFELPGAAGKFRFAD